MSYILDALKRAETERARGAAPGLHTQHQSPGGLPANAGVSRRGLMISMMLFLLLAVLAVGIWIWRTPQATPPLTVQPVTLAPTAPTAPTIPITPTQMPVVMPAPPMMAKVVPTPTPAPAPTPATAPSTVTAPANAIPLLTDIPQDLRSQIPKISITGSVYADTPSQRLLLVNNLVLSQGNLVAPELTLEVIQTRSSVFNFRGTRFRVEH
jgi:general secretion pathway protein B